MLSLLRLVQMTYVGIRCSMKSHVVSASGLLRSAFVLMGDNRWYQSCNIVYTSSPYVGVLFGYKKHWKDRMKYLQQRGLSCFPYFPRLVRFATGPGLRTSLSTSYQSCLGPTHYSRCNRLHTCSLLVPRLFQKLVPLSPAVVPPYRFTRRLAEPPLDCCGLCIVKRIEILRLAFAGFPLLDDHSTKYSP